MLFTIIQKCIVARHTHTARIEIAPKKFGYTSYNGNNKKAFSCTEKIPSNA